MRQACAVRLSRSGMARQSTTWRLSRIPMLTKRSAFSTVLLPNLVVNRCWSHHPCARRRILLVLLMSAALASFALLSSTGGLLDKTTSYSRCRQLIWGRRCESSRQRGSLWISSSRRRCKGQAWATLSAAMCKIPACGSARCGAALRTSTLSNVWVSSFRRDQVLIWAPGWLVACCCRTLQTATLIFPAPSAESTDAGVPIVASELCREGLVRLPSAEPDIHGNSPGNTPIPFPRQILHPAYPHPLPLFALSSLQHVHLCDKRQPISHHKKSFPHIDFTEVRQGV